MKSLIDRLFPRDSGPKGSSLLVSRGLDALRMARDARAVMMGDVRRTPSHLELRISTPLHDELTGIDALNDLAFHLKDELMKDLATEKGRTFGDHTIHVTIAPDASLGENELYAMVRNPERRAGAQKGASGAPTGNPAKSHAKSQTSIAPTPASADDEATRLLRPEPDVEIVEEDEDRTMVLDMVEVPVATLTINRPDGSRERIPCMAEQIVIGRSANSERALPEGFVKVDLDLPPTVSREQIAVTIDENGWHVERLGSGGVSLIDGSTIEKGEGRRLSFADPVILDGVAIRVERGA